MPNPISGGYQVPGDLGQRLAGTEKAVAQLQRLMTQPPKIPKPALGGGIVDIASVYTTDYVGIQWPSGDSQLNFGSASYTVETVSGDMSWLSVVGGDIAVAEDGWYQAWCFVDLRWSSQAAAPGASLSVFLNGNPTMPNGTAYYPTHQAGLLWGVVTPAVSPNERMSAGNYWRLEVDGATTSSAAISKSAASWRITRYA